MSDIKRLDDLVRERAHALHVDEVKYLFHGVPTSTQIPLSAFQLDQQYASIDVQSFDLEKLNPFLTPRLLASSTFVNGTDVQDSQQFADTKTTQDQFTVTNTKAFSFALTQSFQITAKVDFGIVVGGSSTTTFNFNWSTTDTVSHSHTDIQTWTWNVTIYVPPHKRVVSELIIQEGTFNPHFTAKIAVSGSAKLVANYIEPIHKVQLDVEWIMDYGILFRAFPDPAVEVVSDRTIVVTINGIFEAVRGLSYYVDTKQYNIKTEQLEKTVVGAPIRNALLEGFLMERGSTRLSSNLDRL
jgi:hypothetical protein